MGMRTGVKMKKDGDYLRHTFHTQITDEQYEDLCKLANEWNLTFSAAIRSCVRIVLEMSELEREKKMRSVAWKK